MNGKRMCLQKLEVWTGDIIDGLCLHVRGLDPEVHGVQIGNKSEFDFQENEVMIIKISIYYCLIFVGKRLWQQSKVFIWTLESQGNLFLINKSYDNNSKCFTNLKNEAANN